MNLFDLAESLAPALALLTAAAPFARRGLSEVARLRRTVTALESAVELHDAQSRGVVLLVRYAGHPRSSFALLQASGWTVAPYDCEPDATWPWGDRFQADLQAADVVVLEGVDAETAAHLARTPKFRQALGPGAAVVLFTPSAGVRYDQGLWGDGDQSVTTPATCEAAVRSAVARRRVIQRLQGVRPGGLAAAKAALPG